MGGGMQSVRQATLIAGVVSAVVLSVFGCLLLTQIEDGRQAEARAFGYGFSLRLVERFHETISPVFMMAGRVDQKTGKVQNFEEHAAELLLDFPLIRALELAPGGIVNFVYPLRGNEAIVGHDLLIDKKRNKEAYQAVARRQLAVAGPFKLMQGGLGAIARYPIFQAAPDGRSNFWGFSIAVIDFPALMRVAGEAEFARQGYLYQLCWVPYGETACKVVLGDQDMPGGDAVTSKILLTAAEWQLALVPSKGWITPFDRVLVLLLILLGSAAAAGLAYRLPRGKSGKRRGLEGSSSPSGQGDQAID